MYLLSDQSFEDMEEELLRLVMETVAQKSYSGPTGDADSSLKPPARLAEAEFSEVARETLKDLRGEKAYGPSYSSLYFTKITDTIRRDVAQAMVHRWTVDDRGYGAFDEIALRLFEHYLDRFEGRVAILERAGLKGGVALNFREISEELLDPFLEPDYDRSLSVQFDLHTKRAPVRLNLEISTTGNAFWELRGSSLFKKSHRKLRDDLQAIVRDFHKRLEWMKEYMGSKPRPGIEELQRSEIQRVLGHYYHEGPVDVAGLKPGISFGDDPLKLGQHARGFIGRCERCDQIVALELVKDLGFNGGTPSWADDSKIYRNIYAEGSLRETFRVIHWACDGKFYLSSRTGMSTPINS